MTDTMQKPTMDEQHDKTPECPHWYMKNLTELDTVSRELFENYAKIPPNEIVAHIENVRNKAFEVFPYPCLGQWRFLNLSIRSSNAYQEVLERVKSGDQYLDIGCCVGQDIRKLVHDGAPSENTYGSDLERAFINIGYELFRDQSTLKTTFIDADVFDTESNLHKLDAKMDIVHASSFFHLFEWDQQVQAAKIVLGLLKPSPGSLLIGRQGGRTKCGYFPSHLKSAKSLFWHDTESLTKFWEQVGKETGTSWKIDVVFDEPLVVSGEDKKGLSDIVPSDFLMIKFVLRRL